MNTNIAMVIVAIIIGCSIIAGAMILGTKPRYQLASGGKVTVFRIDMKNGTVSYCYGAGIPEQRASGGCISLPEGWIKKL